MPSADDRFSLWADWHNHSDRAGWNKNRPQMEPPAEFEINVLNDHGRIRRSSNNRNRIYQTCLVCGQALGSVGIPLDHVGQAIGSAKRGLRKHLLKVHRIADPYADQGAE